MRKGNFAHKSTFQGALDRSRDTERVCSLCGADLELEPESGELHCPICEESGAP